MCNWCKEEVAREARYDINLFNALSRVPLEPPMSRWPEREPKKKKSHYCTFCDSAFCICGRYQNDELSGSC